MRAGSRPNVSICIPAYEQTEYLRVVLDSVAKQRYDDYEVILTDDSINNSVEDLVAGHALRPRIRYVRNATRRGSPGNWNACVALAQGALIKIIHHDDWLADEESLGAFVRMMQANPTADFGFCATRIVRADGRLRRTNRPSLRWLAALEREPELLFIANQIGAPSATIYRSSRGVQFDERLKWLVDVDFYIRMLRTNRRLAFCERTLICTPTGIEHQVTEESLGNAQVELQESIIVFEKICDRVGTDRRYARRWKRLLAQHRVWSMDALVAYTPVPDKLTRYFEDLFANGVWLRIGYGIPRRMRDVVRLVQGRS